MVIIEGIVMCFALLIVCVVGIANGPVGLVLLYEKDVQDRVAVVSLDFLTIDNAVAAFELEQECGVMTRVGLHCAPAAHQSLHTFPQGTVRFAFSASNTFSEIDRCVEGILKIL